MQASCRLKWLDGFQPRQIAAVHGDDKIESKEILDTDLPRALTRNIDPFRGRYLDGPPVRRIADMPVADTGGGDHRLFASSLGQVAIDSFRQRPAADIAQADEEIDGAGID